MHSYHVERCYSITSKGCLKKAIFSCLFWIQTAHTQASHLSFERSKPTCIIDFPQWADYSEVVYCIIYIYYSFYKYNCHYLDLSFLSIIASFSHLSIPASGVPVEIMLTFRFPILFLFTILSASNSQIVFTGYTFKILKIRLNLIKNIGIFCLQAFQGYKNHCK